eukprot:ANDGO_05996.mRNA.1 hypothetical protein
MSAVASVDPFLICAPHEPESRGLSLQQGVSSRVYFAVLRGMSVAVKLFLPRNGGLDNRELGFFRKEMHVLLSCRHPHIVSIVGVSDPMLNSNQYGSASNEKDRVVWYAMEALDCSLGSFLRDYIGDSKSRTRAASVEFAYTVTKTAAAHVISGIRYLHGKGISHGDVQVTNVLVSVGNAHFAARHGAVLPIGNAGHGLVFKLCDVSYVDGEDQCERDLKGYSKILSSMLLLTPNRSLIWLEQIADLFGRPVSPMTVVYCDWLIQCEAPMKCLLSKDLISPCYSCGAFQVPALLAERFSYLDDGGRVRPVNEYVDLQWAIPPRQFSSWRSEFQECLGPLVEKELLAVVASRPDDKEVPLDRSFQVQESVEHLWHVLPSPVFAEEYKSRVEYWVEKTDPSVKPQVYFNEFTLALKGYSKQRSAEGQYCKTTLLMGANTYVHQKSVSDLWKINGYKTVLVGKDEYTDIRQVHPRWSTSFGIQIAIISSDGYYLLRRRGHLSQVSTSPRVWTCPVVEGFNLKDIGRESKMTLLDVCRRALKEEANILDLPDSMFPLFYVGGLFLKLDTGEWGCYGVLDLRKLGPQCLEWNASSLAAKFCYAQDASEFGVDCHRIPVSQDELARYLVQNEASLASSTLLTTLEFLIAEFGETSMNSVFQREHSANRNRLEESLNEGRYAEGPAMQRNATVTVERCVSSLQEGPQFSASTSRLELILRRTEAVVLSGAARISNLFYDPSESSFRQILSFWLFVETSFGSELASLWTARRASASLPQDPDILSCFFYCASAPATRAFYNEWVSRTFDHMKEPQSLAGAPSLS